jgi:hypothetical protein
MSPFKSFKKSGNASSSSRYAREGANTIGVAVTSTSTETWTSGDFSYIAFRSPGQFTVNRSGKIDVCIVGGGGAGGGVDATNPGLVNYTGGGGGAGGVLHRYGETFVVGTYYVDIGGGGSAEEPGFGFPSSIQGRPFPLTGIALTAYGGGRGSRYPYLLGTSGNGASGGGGSWGPNDLGLGNRQTPNGALSIPAPLQPQGYPGGRSNGSVPPSPEPAHGTNVGSGGGGAGGQGLSARTPTTGGAGGDGVAIFAGDRGIPTTYGAPSPPSYAPGRYVGGGGGGGGGTGGGGAGGVGGGGSGSSPISPGPLQHFAAPGTKYTGGGGGGVLNSSFGNGGQGGSGLVIIRWKNIISRGD